MKSRIVFAALTFGSLSSQIFAQHNTLTAGEQAAGYTLLFNGTGTTLTGWRSWNSTTPPSGWVSVPESTWRVIQLNNPIGQAGALITTDATYQNFDLKVEWNIQSTHNSGIFIRYEGFQGGAYPNNWGGASGPESQIAAINNSDGTDPLHRAGTCYDMFPLDARADGWDMKVIGGQTVNYGFYQQFRIIAFNNRIAHYGNGIKLLEYVIRSTAWNTAFTNSKYAPYPRYAVAHPGAFYLQDHGEVGIKFRDMRAKKLTQSPWALGSPYLNNPNDTTSGLRDLTFTDNLFPPVPITNPSDASNGKFGLLSGNGGVSINFGSPGEYAVRLQDLSGKTLVLKSSSGSNPVFLPSMGLGLFILNIQDGNQEIHRGLLRFP